MKSGILIENFLKERYNFGKEKTFMKGVTPYSQFKNEQNEAKNNRTGSVIRISATFVTISHYDDIPSEPFCVLCIRVGKIFQSNDY